ncbi:DUF3367 domain-containing protein [Micromonospora sp. ATA32]|nr:DUF3367 domain-containing protein [Micromonospora sp. ATA32]
MTTRLVRAVRAAPGTVFSVLLLVAIAFGQRPGQVTFDTKLDLAANPIHFLARALHLWNPEATSGELQNQAYGYLFPMGPFFAAGQLLGLPPWITQRLWCALLFCAAFYGLLRLARALRIGTEPTRYAAALGYALAPRMLTEVGALSSEMLSAALLPWVLLPLVNARRIGSPRRPPRSPAWPCSAWAGSTRRSCCWPSCCRASGCSPAGGTARTCGWWPGGASRSPRRASGGSCRCCCSASTACRSWTTSSRPPRPPRSPRSSRRYAARTSGSPTSFRATRGGRPAGC